MSPLVGRDRDRPRLARGERRRAGSSGSAVESPPRRTREPARRPADGRGRARRGPAAAAGAGDERPGRERRRASERRHDVGRGSCGGLQGRGKSMAPDSSACPRITPATPASRRRRTPSRSVMPPATTMSASWRRTSASISSASGVGAAVAQDEAVDAARRPAPRRARRASGGAPRRHGNAASRSGRGSRPTASQSPATARQPASASGRSTMAIEQHDPRGAGGEREPHVVGLLQAARDLERHRDPAPRPRRRPRGWPAPPAGRRRSRRGGGSARPGRRTARRSDRAGRSARRCRPRRRASRRPASARLDVDRRDDVHAV